MELMSSHTSLPARAPGCLSEDAIVCTYLIAAGFHAIHPGQGGRPCLELPTTERRAGHTASARVSRVTRRAVAGSSRSVAHLALNRAGTSGNKYIQCMLSFEGQRGARAYMGWHQFVCIQQASQDYKWYPLLSSASFRNTSTSSLVIPALPLTRDTLIWPVRNPLCLAPAPAWRS